MPLSFVCKQGFWLFGKSKWLRFTLLCHRNSQRKSPMHQLFFNTLTDNPSWTSKDGIEKATSFYPPFCESVLFSADPCTIVIWHTSSTRLSWAFRACLVSKAIVPHTSGAYLCGCISRCHPFWTPWQPPRLPSAGPDALNWVMIRPAPGSTGDA